MGSVVLSKINMFSYLLHEPDALAFFLLLLLIVAGITLGLIYGYKYDRQQDHQQDKAVKEQSLVTTWPHLIRIELQAALIDLLLLAWWAILLEVPVGAKADPGTTPPLAKAPWFFVGIQEMLQYFDPWLAGVVLPLFTIIGLAALPYLDTNPTGNGHYTLRNRPVALIILAVLLFWWLIPMAVGLLLRGEHWAFQAVWRSSPLDNLQFSTQVSLAQKMHLSPVTGQVLGGFICLGPFFLLALSWLRSRKYFWALRLGFARYFFAGSLLLVLTGVVIKVALLLMFNIRYIWVTPWFRI